MSVLHRIITDKEIDPDVLLGSLQNTYPQVEGRDEGEGVLYFYLDQESCRGVNLSKTDYGYELRTTIMSDDMDYRLANEIATIVWQVTEATIVDEDDEAVVQPMEVFPKSRYYKMILADAQLIHLLSGPPENKQITLFGPLCQVYFGPRTHKYFKKHEGSHSALAYEMIKMMIKVQYQLPKSDSDTVMQLGEGKGKKILKLLTRECSYIIRLYDYVLLLIKENNDSMDNMVAISNDVLNTILPASWELIDEYTIVAPRLQASEYDALVARALPHNKIKDL